MDQKRLTTTELDLNVKMGEDDAPYRLDLNTRVRSGGDTVRVLLDDSEIILDSIAWDFSNQGRIAYAQNYLDIDRVFLKSGDQELYISTKNSQEQSDLQVEIQQFEIQPFLNSIDLEDLEVEGVLYGKATLEDLFQSGPITADLNIAGLTVRDTLVGDFKLQAEKSANTDGSADLLELLAKLQGPNGNLLVDGSYDLAADATEPINIELKLSEFLLNPWKIFLEEQVNELSGELFADLSVTGSPTKPNLVGTLRFGEGVIIEPAISSARYQIRDQQMSFTGEEIQLNKFTILDSAGTSAVLDGTIGFSDLTNPLLT